MTEPARGGATDPRPATAADRRPDPGEAAVRRALIAAAESNALAVARLAARADDGAALEMVRLSIAVLENLGEAARHRVLDEAVLEQAEAAAFEAGRAWRRRLEVLNGGHAMPGPH
jgi:hypothetical protein